MLALLATILTSPNAANLYSANNSRNIRTHDLILPAKSAHAPICTTKPIVDGAARNMRIDYRCVTVQVVNGEQKGSGVIVRDSSHRILIATNKHVVTGVTNVCVSFYDNRKLSGMVFSNEKSPADVAFVFVEGLSSLFPYAVQATNYDPLSIEPVISTGYQALTNKYTQTNGLTIPIIPGKRLQSGYSLTYTNNIEKGMSGGGIFDVNGSLLGINAVHSDPLWEGFWTDSSGNPVEERISRKLDHVSIGVDSQTIFAELEKLTIKLPEKNDPIACSI